MGWYSFGERLREITSPVSGCTQQTHLRCTTGAANCTRPQERSTGSFFRREEKFRVQHGAIRQDSIHGHGACFPLMEGYFRLVVPFQYCVKALFSQRADSLAGLTIFQHLAASPGKPALFFRGQMSISGRRLRMARIVREIRSSKLHPSISAP